MLKKYIFLNILFIFGLMIYLLSLNTSISIKDTFYLFFSLFSIVIPLTFLFSEFEYEDKESSRSYKLLFFGFTAYGIGNFIWYLNEILGLKISLNYLNSLFLFQGFTKHFFLRYLTKLQEETNYNQIFNKIFSLNMLIMLFALFTVRLFDLNNFFLDFYFIFESIVSIVFIFYFLKENFTAHIDIKYFLMGQSLWLFADLLYFFEVYWDVYLIGSLSDFIYFIGFYLMLSSVIFKNFNFSDKLELLLDKKLRFS
jgi:hypothetical protein